jgi:hypothetical protein
MKAAGEHRLKYLEMLQDVIGRMADNQFTIRKWSVAIGTAVIGFAASKDKEPPAALLAIFPAVLFWVLDAYYLALELKFRARFDAAADEHSDAPDFSFKVKITASDWLAASQHWAVWLVHLPVILLAVAIGGVAAWLK